ncbi:MAG: hypothetical protein JWO72_297 [Caulobacteraceae bacterium]|nr:hypothetical protein [Caulobacteraceae bacterium]
MQRPSRLSGRSMARAGGVCALGLLGLAVVASAPLNKASAAQSVVRQCFRAQDWMGTSAGGPRDLYVRIGMKDVWHLGLAQDCAGAEYPGPVRVDDTVSGSNEICAAADMQIRVGPKGFSHTTPCIVASLERLTPEEIKALPRKVVP